MALTPEGRVKAAVKKVLDAEGVWYFMPAANGYGRAGIPDFICCVNGYFLAIECKAGNNEPTLLQERELDRIIKAGGIALVIHDSPEDFRALGTIVAGLQLRNKQ
jgi:Holliday junction resolvase